MNLHPNKLINVQVLHDDVEDLNLPKFRGINFSPGELEIVLGDSDADGNLMPRLPTTEEVALVEALVEGHDKDRKTRWELRQAEQKNRRKDIRDRLKGHADPVLRDLAVLLEEEEVVHPAPLPSGLLASH
jgi:hypothetical protein